MVQFFQPEHPLLHPPPPNFKEAILKEYRKAQGGLTPDDEFSLRGIAHSSLQALAHSYGAGFFIDENSGAQCFA